MGDACRPASDLSRLRSCSWRLAVTLHGQVKEDVAAFEATRRSGVAANRGAAVQRDEEAEERMNTGFIVPFSIGATVFTDPAKLRGADDEIAQQTGAMKGIALDRYPCSNEDGTTGVGWRVFNPLASRQSGKRFDHWPECVLAPWATEDTGAHKLAGYVRCLCGIIAEGSGLLSDDEARLVGDIQRLISRLQAKGKGRQ
jgi:hypothetical protein